MSRDKQNEIHELAKQMSEAISTAVEQRYIEDEAKLRAVLIENGWRKASDVVRDIFNDLNEMWHKGRGFINYSDLVRLERLHEQKYTEEGK